MMRVWATGATGISLSQPEGEKMSNITIHMGLRQYLLGDHFLMDWLIMEMLRAWPNEGDLWGQASPRKSIEEFQALLLKVGMRQAI